MSEKILILAWFQYFQIIRDYFMAYNMVCSINVPSVFEKNVYSDIVRWSALLGLVL